MAKSINKVELQGTVGTVKFFPVVKDAPRMVKFSMATEYAYNSKDGMVVIDTTWHSLSFLESKANELNWLERGKVVHITGRIRNVRYMDDNGQERSISEIVVEDIYQVRD